MISSDRLHEPVTGEIPAGAERLFAGRFAVQIDVLTADAETLHEVACQRDRGLKLLFRQLGLLEVPDQTNTDPAIIAVHIPGRNMRPPELETPAFGLDDPAKRQASAVPDQKVIGDHIDGVSGLALAMDAPKEIDVAKAAAAMMDRDVMPTPRPIKGRRDQQRAHPQKCQQPPPCHVPPWIILLPEPVIRSMICLR